MNKLVKRSLVISMIFTGVHVMADEPEIVPHLVISGIADEPVKVEIGQYDRIYFGDESMVLRSSTDTDVQDIELLYSLYNMIAITNEPKEQDVVREESIDPSSQIIYQPQYKSLTVESDSDELFTVGVFNATGSLVLAGKIKANDAISLENLSSGFYIAIATSGTSKSSLKFIIN